MAIKILIIKPSSFGDIIQANPVLQAVKTQWQDARIDWLVFKRWQQVVELFENVSNIKVWDRDGGIKAFLKILRECRKEKYDIVIDLQGLLRTALFARLLNAKQKIGVSGMKELSWIFIREPYLRDLKENAVLRNLKSLTYITGKDYQVEFKIKNLNLSDEFYALFARYGLKEKDRIVSFVPFSRGKTKSWHADNYIELANNIKQNGKDIKILVLGSSGDYGKIKSELIIDLCGKTSMAMLSYILRKSICAVGADTGAMHLANALGTKSAFIFGGSDINETAPFGDNCAVLNANLPCSPCRGKCKFNVEKCLEKIKPEQVIETIKEWIK